MEGTAAAIRHFRWGSRRLAVWLVLVGLLPGVSLGAAAADPRLPVVQTSSLPRSEGITVVDGIAYYSHYSLRSVDGKDILQVDPESGATIRLVEDVPDAQFVAVDDRYVVYSQRGYLGRPLVLRDRKSGATSTSIKLQQAVIASRLEQNRLVVFQQLETLFFSLPDLKLVGRKPWPWAVRPAFATLQIEHQGNRFVALDGRALHVLDDELNLLADLPVEPSPIRGGVSCDIAGLKLANSIALVSPQCGLVRAYDLDTGKVRYELDVGEIRPQFGIPQLEVVADVLFVVDRSANPRPQMRMFDLVSGRSLGRVAGAADGMASRGGRLLTFELGAAYSDPARVVVYGPDFGAIRDEKMRLARVIEGCGGPADDVVRNPYAVVQACEEAGIKDYLAVVDLPRELHPALARYATGLANTTSKFQQSLPVLDRLEPSAEFDVLRALVARKQAYLGPVVMGPRSEPARPGVRNPAFPDLFAMGTVFIGPRMFMYGFDSGENASDVSLRAYDRKTLQLLKELPIIPGDRDDEDSINSVQEAAGSLLVGLQNKYDDARPNLAVVDPRNFSLVGVLEVPGGMERLEMCGDKVLYTYGAGPAMEVDLKTARLVQLAPDDTAVCNVPGALKPIAAESTEVDAETPGFRLQTSHTNNRSAIVQVENKASPEKSYDLAFRPDVSFIGVPGRDAVIAREGEGIYGRLSLLDLASRESRILLELGGTPGWGMPAAWRNYLLQPRGRDLLVYDLDRRQVIGYDAALVSAVCDECRVPNGIERLVVDGDRLLVFATNGENSRVIDLPAYVQSFGSVDLFMRNSR